MKRTTLHRSGIAAVALALTLPLAACGSDSDDAKDSGDSTSESTSMESPTMQDPSTGSDESKAGENAADQTFGPGCAMVPASGAGSFDGMATAPVATAASANPLLSTLVTAVGKAGLGDTLNSAEALTVFAPTNDAFAKIPAKDLKAVLTDKAMLTKLLTHHVVEGKLSPEDVAGPHKTLAGDTIKVTGSGEDFKVAGQASVVCGNVPTANATVYLIDSVLMP